MPAANFLVNREERLLTPWTKLASELLHRRVSLCLSKHGTKGAQYTLMLCGPYRPSNSHGTPTAAALFLCSPFLVCF